MQAILKLDVSGQPRGWLTLNEAVTAYARGDVLYGIGDTLPPVFGGVQRLTGIRSEIILQPIVALQGRVMNHFTPPLCNRTLFRRDDHRCLYCGGQFSRSELTRDHVLPISRGGTDKWETWSPPANAVTGSRTAKPPRRPTCRFWRCPSNPTPTNGISLPKNVFWQIRWSTCPSNSEQSATGRTDWLQASAQLPGVIDHFSRYVGPRYALVFMARSDTLATA